MIQYLFLLIFIILIVLKIYLKLSTGWCKSPRCLIGKTVLITGATSGIGYETALDLAKRGARLILTSRTEKEGKQLELKIISETGNPNIRVEVVEFSSFSSVHNFAEKILQSENRLDILINNAGATGVGNFKTENACLYLMQVNYFSAFLLTNLLLGLLKKTPGSRVINVASLLAQYVYDLDVTTLNEYPGHYNSVYSRSKLCNILFTIELAKRLKGSCVSTFSVHPGVVRSKLFDNLDILGKFIISLGWLFFKSSEEGAQTIIYCAVCKNLEKYNGEHFVDCRRVERYRNALDVKLCKELWKQSAKIVNFASSSS